MNDSSVELENDYYYTDNDNNLSKYIKINISRNSTERKVHRKSSVNSYNCIDIKDNRSLYIHIYTCISK